MHWPRLTVSTAVLSVAWPATVDHKPQSEPRLTGPATPKVTEKRPLNELSSDCLGRILEYTNAERSRFDASRLVQDAVIRNLQTLAKSSQRLSSEVKGTEPQIPWRELAGFRSVIVHA